MTEEHPQDPMRAALRAADPSWGLLLESDHAGVQGIVTQIVARLELLSAGDLIHLETVVDEQADRVLSVEVRAFTASLFIQLAAEADPSGDGRVAFSTATPLTAVTRVAIRDVRMDAAGARVGVMFDLTFGNGEVATIGGRQRADGVEKGTIRVLEVALAVLGRQR